MAMNQTGSNSDRRDYKKSTPANDATSSSSGRDGTAVRLHPQSSGKEAHPIFGKRSDWMPDHQTAETRGDVQLASGACIGHGYVDGVSASQAYKLARALLQDDAAQHELWDSDAFPCRRFLMNNPTGRSLLEETVDRVFL